MESHQARDVKADISFLVRKLELTHIKASRIFCYRNLNSTSRSYARIWALPKIFQKALGIQPAYVVEVIASHFDRLDSDRKKRVLIHELLHIPKNFSGGLLPHRSHGRHLESKVNDLFNKLKNDNNSSWR